MCGLGQRGAPTPKRRTSWKIRCAAPSGENSKVAVNLSGLSYISSAGLRAVLQAARAAEVGNAEFAVCSLTASVQKVFDMSGLHHVLRIQGELPC